VTPDEDPRRTQNGVTKASTHGRESCASAGLGAIACVDWPRRFLFRLWLPKTLSRRDFASLRHDAGGCGAGHGVQRCFRQDVYGAITGQGPAAREALMPLLFGLIAADAAGALRWRWFGGLGSPI